jgi:hypothetical protein
MTGVHTSCPTAIDRILQGMRLAASAWLIMGIALLLGACSENPQDRLRAEAKQFEARDWKHLAGMPAPQTVLSRIGHADPVIAIVRQCQALTQLHKLFNDPLFAPRALGTLPATGQQLRGEYQRMIEQDLYARFRKARNLTRDAGSAWRQACRGEAPQWKSQKLQDREWLALLASPAREMAERQNAWYEKSLPAFAAAKQEARLQRTRNERLTVMFIGALVTLLGLFMMRRGWRIQRALDKYEFENRTEGGVVEFESHDAALRHRRRKYFANQFLFLGGSLVAILGVIVLLARMFD